MAPHPAVRVRTLAELHEAIAGCRMCPRVTPPPDPLGARGTACADRRARRPASRSRVRRLPFAGAAGRKLVTWLAPLGIADHEDMLERFAFAAVAKCYPGRVPGGRGDRAPDRGERERCRPWTDALVRLCDPAVVVPVGRLAIDDWLGRAPLGRGRGRALRARRPRDRAAPPPLGRERVDERPGQSRARRPRRRTAARHAPLTVRDGRVTPAGPSVRGRGTWPGDRRDGGPVGPRRAAPAADRRAARAGPRRAHRRLARRRRSPTPRVALA